MSTEAISTQMKIASLCKATGFSRSTIHSYLRMGLLPPPTKAGLNLHYYHERHVETLRTIRYLREQKKMSLDSIKEALSNGFPIEIPIETNSGMTTDLESNNETKDKNHQKGHQIVDKAIYLFSKYGYEDVKISDITDSLHMGKGTFYLYFSNKQELLLACFEQLRSLVQPLEQMDAIAKENNFYIRMKNRWIGFQSIYDKFPGILNLLRTAVNSTDPYVRERARDSYDSIIGPLREDVQRAIRQGAARDIDPELFAYTIWGMAEHVAFRLTLDDKYNNDDVAALMLDLVSRMMLPDKANQYKSETTDSAPATITDLKGIKSTLDNLLFDKSKTINAKIGDASVSIEIAAVKMIIPKDVDGSLIADITTKDGDKFTALLPHDLILSGSNSLGTFTLPMKSITSIEF